LTEKEESLDINDIRAYVDDRPAEGVFRVHRDVFTDPALFELEQKYIFERTWNFLTIESQLPKPGDFITTSIARTPLLITRDKAGQLNAFTNVCRHKGSVVTRLERGNAKYHVCAYHGWAYDPSGRNVDIKEHAAGRYTPAFDAENHDLTRIARLESYKGLVFGSLSADVPPLEDYLGDMRFFLDLVMEQGPNGMEFIPGRAIYTFRANWKMQMDNGLDSYHLNSTHASFADVLARRRSGQGNQAARQFDWAKRASVNGGMFSFANGHSAVWSHQSEPEKRPIYPAIDEVRRRLGDLRADWMLKLRNTIIFPNFQTADSTSLLIRTFRPLSVDRTEMRVHCLGPIGEAREVRSWRLRQFEDFFNPSGFATPDDSAVYEDCQIGTAGTGFDYLDGYGRGMGILEQGANATAQSVGIEPTVSLEGPFDVSSEMWHHAPHREWLRLMEAGMAGQKAYP
jgi:benzoate/toluate 1,2-dioxygenase alpha subunit